MKRSSIIFLKSVIPLIAIGTLAVMIRFPLTEGRAASLDLFSIYSDPFILYGYIASIPFFVALYQTFKLLGYIGRNEASLPCSMKALRTIKYCAIIQSILIAIAGLYIRMFHAKDDDPAGFLAIGMAAILISLIVAKVAAKFEKRLQQN